jgi:hypothetical protein
LKLLFATVRTDVKARSLLVTLTYPEVFPDCSTARGHRAALEKRIKRRWSDACIIWRLELQKRGAPHFHLMILGVDWIPCQWLSQAWYEVVGSGDPKHLKSGTNVQRARNEYAASKYLEKAILERYLSKSGQDDDVDGRSWGVSRNLETYVAPTVSGELSGKHLARLVRLFDGVQRARVRFYRSRRSARRPGRPDRPQRAFRRRCMTTQLPGVLRSDGRELVTCRSLRWFMDGSSFWLRWADILALIDRDPPEPQTSIPNTYSERIRLSAGCQDPQHFSGRTEGQSVGRECGRKNVPAGRSLQPADRQYNLIG